MTLSTMSFTIYLSSLLNEDNSYPNFSILSQAVIPWIRFILTLYATTTTIISALGPPKQPFIKALCLGPLLVQSASILALTARVYRTLLYRNLVEVALVFQWRVKMVTRPLATRGRVSAVLQGGTLQPVPYVPLVRPRPRTALLKKQNKNR